MEVIEDAFSKLEETQAALVNSEQMRQAGNHERVVMPPTPLQEVFVVLKFQSPQPLPVGGYRLFTVQKKAVDRTLRQFIDDNLDLRAAEMTALRFEPSPRGHFVYQRMKADKEAPIEFSRTIHHNFALKEGRIEAEMVEYVTRVFNTHTQGGI